MQPSLSLKQTAHLLGVGILAAALGLAGCRREPITCECYCQGPIPPEAKVRIEKAGEKPGAKGSSGSSAAGATKVAPPPKPSAARNVAPPPSAPPPVQRKKLAKVDGSRKAQGRVASEPGSGTPVELPPEDAKEILDVFVNFAKAAGKHDFAEMRKWTTERLGKALESAMNKYKERLFRRTDIFADGVKAGPPKMSDVREVGDGNFDVEFKFANGKSVRVLFFKELGHWRLNRL